MTMAFTYKDYTESDAVRKKQTALDTHLQGKPGEFYYRDYAESDAVKNYLNQLEAHNKNKPGAFQYGNQDQWDAIMDKILNRDKFSYDLNGDALYQQYKNQYMTQGNQAMMDTMGQAAAMTGGYGNSYAQTAGQQTYQGYLQQLNDRVPELYQLALSKYQMEGDDLYKQYGLYQSDFERQYGMHRDQVSDWNAERNYLTDRYDSERAWDYGKYTDDRNFAYGQHRDTVADWQTDRSYLQTDLNNERNFDYGKYTDEKNFAYGQYVDDRNYNYQVDQDRIAQQNWQKEFDLASSKVTTGGDGGEESISLYDYAYKDAEKGLTYYQYEGKTIAVETGVNPYTRTKNPDIKHGTFSNGYQPNNIGGVKLKKVDGESYNMNGRVQNVWTANGKYYVWDGTKNKYVQVTMKTTGSKTGGGVNGKTTNTLK